MKDTLTTLKIAYNDLINRVTFGEVCPRVGGRRSVVSVWSAGGIISHDTAICPASAPSHQK